MFPLPPKAMSRSKKNINPLSGTACPNPFGEAQIEQQRARMEESLHLRAAENGSCSAHSWVSLDAMIIVNHPRSQRDFAW
jgi:hypothetical protein